MLAFLDDMDFFFQDLVKVEDKLPTRFPPDWKIFTTYVKAYHAALYDLFHTYVNSDETDPASLLALAQYSKKYVEIMTGDLAISPDLLEPPLLDGKQQDLVDDYMKLIIRKMDEWMSNLQRTEQSDFVTRENPPEEDADGMYGMQGAVILFQSASRPVAALNLTSGSQ
jgi:exocyst complex component 3